MRTENIALTGTAYLEETLGLILQEVEVPVLDVGHSRSSQLQQLWSLAKAFNSFIEGRHSENEKKCHQHSQYMIEGRSISVCLSRL